MIKCRYCDYHVTEWAQVKNGAIKIWAPGYDALRQHAKVEHPFIYAHIIEWINRTSPDRCSVDG